jgi:O-antigen ligase
MPRGINGAIPDNEPMLLAATFGRIDTTLTTFALLSRPRLSADAAAAKSILAWRAAKAALILP